MAHFKLYLPKTASHYNSARDAILRELAEQAGGFTEYNANGGWVNSDGEIVEEPVTVIESYGDIDGERVARFAKRMTGETAIAYAVDGTMHMAED